MQQRVENLRDRSTHATARLPASRGFILFATLLAVYFVATAGLRPLVSPDEGRYLSIARDMLVTGDWVTPRLNGIPFLDKPILFYWLAAGSMALFGQTPFAMRLVPAVMGVVACLAIGRLGERLFGRTAGLLAGTALATMPLFYLGAHFASMDVEVAFWITLTLVCALAAIESPDARARGRLWLGAWACAALGVLTKGLIGVVLPALVVGAWLLVTRRWSVLAQARPGAGLALFAAIALPWFVAVQLRNPVFFDYFFVFQHFTRYTGGNFNNAEPAWFFVAVLAVALLPWTALAPQAGAYLAAELRGQPARREALWFVLLWAAVIVVFFSLPRAKPVGYILPAVPPLALLAGLVLARVVERAPASAWRDPLAGWCALVLLLVGAVALWVVLRARVHPAFAQARALVLPTVALAGLAVALVAWLRRAGAPVAHRRAAAAVVAAMGAALCLTLLARVPLATADSQRRLGLALREALAAQPAPVAYFRFFPYSVPLYAGLREPALLVEGWGEPRATASDNWRLTLWRASDWQPETRRLFLTPPQFVARTAARGLTYVAIEPRELVELRALAAQHPGVSVRVLHDDGQMLLVALQAS